MSARQPTSLIDHHISPLSTYLKVFAALLALTALTVGVAFVDLGPFSDLVAVAIASVKAVLVAWFFMHLSHSAKITWVVAAAGFIWLAVMIGITLADYLSRGWIPAPEGWS